METINDNLPSQPIITDTEVQEILNKEEDKNNSTVAVEVSEEVTDTQATVNRKISMIFALVSC